MILLGQLMKDFSLKSLVYLEILYTPLNFDHIYNKWKHITETLNNAISNNYHLCSVNVHIGLKVTCNVL